MSHSSVALLIASVLTIGAVWLEQSKPAVWNDRLLLAAWREEPARHTPRHTTGTFLPERIAENVTFTPADNPLILRADTEVAPDSTLTLAPGTHIYAAEFARLDVTGQLIARGTPGQPIIFTTNEVHADNQLWGGIIAHTSSTVTLAHATLEYAAPGLGCLRGSEVTAEMVTIRNSPLGVYTETALCVLRDSLITAVRTGLIAVAESPPWTNTVIRAHVRERLDAQQPY